MSHVLEVRDLGFAYQDRPVLRNVGFDLDRGEMIAILGANGSGKTTLLRVLAGALEGSGMIRLHGRAVVSYSRRELARRVAVVSQDPAVPAGWTVEEVVWLGRTPHIGLLGAPSPEDRHAVRRAMELTEIEELAPRPYQALSGGERQRVMVAVAIAQGAELLLLDEPTAHLDLKYRALLLDSIADLRDKVGLTVIAAMHDPSLAAQYFGRVMLLSQGEVLADGRPTDVLTEPLLEQTYGVVVRVLHDEETGLPVVGVLGRRARFHTARG